MIDFLILFEHKVRELENACLLKNKLEEKGYSVKIISIYSFRRSFINYKVLIVPHLYDDNQVQGFICKYKNRTCKVVNMQYEQVFNKKDFDSGFSYPKGNAKKAILFSWGLSEYNRYLNDKDQKSIITGCISMDFDLSLYNDFFLKKEDILNKYCIDQRNKILLFISNFAVAEASEDYIKKYFAQEVFEDTIKFARLLKKSKDIIIEWLKLFVQKNNDFVVIYRPHPAEYEDCVLNKLERENTRFRIIRDYSIRQWIRISDYTFTWGSSSIVDAYYAEKKCGIVRPLEIPQDLDVPFMIGANHIKSYQDFCECIETNSNFSYINEAEIKKYYSNEIGRSCIDTIIDNLVSVYKDDSYLFEFKTHYKLSFKSIKSAISDMLYDLGNYINLEFLYKAIYKNNKQRLNQKLLIQRDVYHYQIMIKEYIKRLKNIYD